MPKLSLTLKLVLHLSPPLGMALKWRGDDWLGLGQFWRTREVSAACRPPRPQLEAGREARCFQSSGLETRYICSIVQVGYFALDDETACALCISMQDVINLQEMNGFHLAAL